jgi:hypothetical protein
MNRPRLALACSLVLSLAPATRSDDAAISRRELDWRMDQVVYNAIVAGIPFYNQCDFAGLYRLYQGALISVEPVLSHHPELRQAMEKGLRDAEGARDDSQKAIEQRRVLDEVLAGVRGMVPPPAPAPATKPPSAPAPAPALTSIPLWALLGVEPVVRDLVYDFVSLAGADPDVDLQIQARRRGPGPVRKAPGRVNQLDERRPADTRAAT